MHAHGISELDIDIAVVSESSVSTRSQNRPPVWMSRLARVVSKAFGVTYFHRDRINTNQYVFVGIGPSPEIAGYAFTVLRRQLTRARRDWIKNRYGKRGKVSTRTRKGDLFALAWVYQVEKFVTEFAMSVSVNRKINNYLSVYHPDLVEYKKQADIKKSDGEALLAGMSAAKDVRLHHGMRGRHQSFIGVENG